MRPRSTLLSLSASCALLALCSPHGSAQEKKKDTKKVEPRVLLAIPLGVAQGQTAKVTFRGLHLDTAKEFRFSNPKAKIKVVPLPAAKILSKGKAAVPDKNPDKVGDTQVVAEVTVPLAWPSEPVLFTVVTAAGETKPHALLIEHAGVPVLAEKEPNDGFRQAQLVPVPCAVDGLIERPRDVDVFRVEGKAGQRLVLEVLAARHGSALDSILTVYDAAGREVASNDDMKDSVDSRLEVTLPRDGPYYVSLIDAHDQGGPTHVYRLVARLK